MSGILRRSKSTRDARAKLTRDQLDFNFAAEIGPAAAAAVATTGKASEPTATTRLLGLARRKSVSSFRPTQAIAFTADSHPKTADPRNRQSVLYREEEMSPVPPLPNRSGSGMSNYGMGSDRGTIGMAIGSPTEIIQQPQSGTSEKSEALVFPTHSVSGDAGTSSVPKPPGQRFEVWVEGAVANSIRRNTLHKERENEMEKDKGKDLKNSRQQEDLPKTGWRKVFARSFFSKKTSPKQQPQLLQPEPTTKKLELITRDGLSPHVVAKGPTLILPSGKVLPSPAPCLNVDLPGVEMERYSVMFGTLLHPSEKSTIFARRKSRDVAAGGSKDQATTGTEAQLYLTPIKRHATTGQISRSPVSMLNVSPLHSAGGAGRTPSPSRLSRSNTTTEGSPSLSPQTMYMVRAHSRREELNDPKSSITPGSSLRPRVSSKISKISEESLIDTPRGSFDDGDDEWMAEENDSEPQWEMVTSGGKASDEPMSEEQIETAAQISIARQISISQRQLLIPIVPRSQRLVSRAPIRKAMVNPKPPTERLDQGQEQQQVQAQVRVQVPVQDVEPGLAC